MEESACIEVGGLSLRLATADDGSMEPLFSDVWLGTELWPAARVLIAYLEGEPAVVEGRGVLELGAGTGACGLAAAVLGARRVVLTDKPSLLPTLQHNVDANLRAINAADVACEPLEWSAAVVMDGPIGDADVVLMSECLNPVYGDQHASALAATLHTVLRRAAASRPADAPAPLGLLSQTRRGEGVAESVFFEECARFGLVATLVTEALPGEQVGTLCATERPLAMQHGIITIHAIHLPCCQAEALMCDH
jgi:hypothetical protein